MLFSMDGIHQIFSLKYFELNDPRTTLQDFSEINLCWGKRNELVSSICIIFLSSVLGNYVRHAVFTVDSIFTVINCPFWSETFQCTGKGTVITPLKLPVHCSPLCELNAMPFTEWEAYGATQQHMGLHVPHLGLAVSQFGSLTQPHSRFKFQLFFTQKNSGVSDTLYLVLCTPTSHFQF